MILSRKEFFRHGLLSLGETLLAVGESVREAQATLYCAPAQPRPEGEPAAGAVSEPVPGPDLVARADNRHCLAKCCGCFSCLESCPAEAISLVPGEGISIDPALCTGCGDCCRICPLAPQALALVAREKPASPAT